MEIVELLLQDIRIDPSILNNQAIRFASENGHLSIVKLLLADSRVDPSDSNDQAIRLASENLVLMLITQLEYHRVMAI